MTSLLASLSSQTGDRTESANRMVVDRCLKDPSLVTEIAAGLASPDSALVGDCAEVLTHLAEHHPDWVAPYAHQLAALGDQRATRVRWEGAHALALVASTVPEDIETHLPALALQLRNDASVIVRDHATETLGAYGATGRSAAEKAYPLLIEVLSLWNGKQAGHALNGLAKIARLLPEKGADLQAVAVAYSKSSRGVVRQAARRLLRALTP